MPPKKKAPQPSTFVVETYGDPSFAVRNLRREPSCVNVLEVIRYRVTVERIEEPRDVVLERMRRLWRESERNIHVWDRFRKVAVELGLTDTEARAMFDAKDQGVDYKPGRR